MGLYIDGKPATVGPLIINELLQGYMDWRRTLGGEKVTNGTFTGAATGWTEGTDWTYGANAETFNGAGTGTLTQDVAAVVGDVYRVEYEITVRTGGSVTVSVGGTSGTARSSAAVFVEYIKAATTGVLTFTPSAGANLTIDNVSVKKVGYVGADSVGLFIEDRGATAGKGALHMVTEDGTGHVFGDRVGIGTLYPTVFCEITGLVQLNDQLQFSTSGAGIFTTTVDGATLLLVARNAAAQTQTVAQITGNATVANSTFAISKAGNIEFLSGNGLSMTASTSLMSIVSGVSSPYGANLYMYGRLHATKAGYLEISTPNAANNAEVIRLTITGVATTAVATWAAVTHTGLQITSAGTIEGAGTGANGFKLKNLKNAAASALSGTQLDVEIDIGGTPYYFTVYPTKA